MGGDFYGKILVWAGLGVLKFFELNAIWQSLIENFFKNIFKHSKQQQKWYETGGWLQSLILSFCVYLT